MRRLKPALAMAVLFAVAGACILTSSAKREARIWIAPETVDCVGVGPQKCLLVKESEDAEWGFFYDGIDGFTFVEGVSYVIDVEITEIEDPPADASSLEYRLIRVVEEIPGGG